MAKKATSYTIALEYCRDERGFWWYCHGAHWIALVHDAALIAVLNKVHAKVGAPEAEHG